MGWSRMRVTDSGLIRWTAYYRNLQGWERSAGTFSRKRDAEAAWKRAEAKIADGRCLDLVRGRWHFTRYVMQEWLPGHVMEETTREAYEATVQKFLLGWFGKMKMMTIGPGEVRTFLHDLQHRGVSPATRARCKTVLSAIFTTALQDQVIFRHPCAGVKTATQPQLPLRILTPQEYQLVRDAMAPQWRVCLDVFIETGIRWGEFAELRVGDLHHQVRMLTIVRTVSERRGQRGERFRVKPYTKNAEYRTLEISQRLVEELVEHECLHHLADGDLLFTHPSYWGDCEATEHQAASRNPRRPALQVVAEGHGTMSDYNKGCRCRACRAAYADYRASRRAQSKDRPPVGRRACETDGHLPRDWFRKQVWYRALDHAGIPHEVRIHDLRHTHASWLLAGGADVETVRERLGHRSLRATEKYLHTLPGHDHAALQAFEQVRNTA